MKRYILFLTFLLPVLLSAQKVDYIGYDREANSTVAYTTWEKFHEIKTNNGKFEFMFRFFFEKNRPYLQLIWQSPKYTSISASYNLSLKTESGNIYDVKAVEYTSSDLGNSKRLEYKVKKEGVSPCYEGQYSFLDNNDHIDAMRITTREGYVNLNLKKGDARKIQRAYKRLMDEVYD